MPITLVCYFLLALPKLRLPCFHQTINILGLSSDGRHVAAGCVDGVIAIIDWQKRKLVEK